MMKGIPSKLITLLVATACALPALAGPAQQKKMAAQGRYMIAVSGCNDCHTHQYPEKGGKIPEVDWLTGSNVGFNGPWGTTYPANLRLLVQNLTEEQWLQRARTEMRPPMPWFSLHDMKEKDLSAIYHFIRSLGPKGDPAPNYAPPGQIVYTPYIDFTPKNLPPGPE